MPEGLVGASQANLLEQVANPDGRGAKIFVTPVCWTTKLDNLGDVAIWRMIPMLGRHPGSHFVLPPHLKPSEELL